MLDAKSKILGHYACTGIVYVPRLERGWLGFAPVRDALEAATRLKDFRDSLAGLSSQFDDTTLIDQVQKATTVAMLSGMFSEKQRE